MSYSLIYAYPVRWLNNRSTLLPKDKSVIKVVFDYNNLVEQENIVKKIKNKLPIVLDIPLNQTVIGKIKANGLVLLKDQKISLASNAHLHDVNIFNWHDSVIPTSRDLSQQVKKSDRIYINHEQVILLVEEVHKYIIRAKVSRGGKISSNDQVMTAKQVIDFSFNKDLLEVINQWQPKYLAVPAGKYKKISQVKREIVKSSCQLLVKISQFKQLEYLNDILPLTGGLLIDLPSLSLTMPQTKVSDLQKRLINLAKEKNKLVIISGILPKNE